MKFSKNYDVDNDPIFIRFAQLKEHKGLSEHTIRSYHNSLEKLCKGNKESLSNIVETCKLNQKSRVEANGDINEFSPNAIDSAINIYLDGFINFCKENGNKNTTINKGMASIRSFLSYYDVKLPKWEQFKDDADDWYLLTKEDIRYVLSSCNIHYTSLTTFLASTGMREEDACSLTIGDFMKATKEYHDFTDVEEFIDKAPQDMIGYWNFHPKKTQRFNIVCKTFNSPESSNYILQSLRKLKNEYIPNKNQKSGLDIKLEKKSALFGSRRKYFLEPLEVKSVTRFYTEKNKDLYQWNVDRIDQKLKKGELTGDREEYIKKIPKLHPHAFRKFFIDTIRKKGDISVCVTLEGHKPIISTDKNYVKPTKEIVKEVYIKALPDLSIAPIEARIITDSEAEELREEVKSLNRKLEEKDDKIETLESKLQERESKDKEIEDRLGGIERSILAQVGNPARIVNRTSEETFLKISISSYINRVDDREDKIAKRIQEFNEDEVFALNELAYEIAITENIDDIEKAIKKAIFKVTTKPELVAQIGEYRKERKINQEKIDKFLKILREEIAKIGIFDEDDLKEIGKPFMDNVNNILIDDIDEEFVHAEIEKYL